MHFSIRTIFRRWKKFKTLHLHFKSWWNAPPHRQHIKRTTLSFRVLLGVKTIVRFYYSAGRTHEPELDESRYSVVFSPSLFFSRLSLHSIAAPFVLCAVDLQSVRNLKCIVMVCICDARDEKGSRFDLYLFSSPVCDCHQRTYQTSTISSAVFGATWIDAEDKIKNWFIRFEFK